MFLTTDLKKVKEVFLAPWNGHASCGHAQLDCSCFQAGAAISHM